MSRIANSMKNFVSGMFGMGLTTVAKFITRSVFIMTLGKKFLGVSALFTNIISILSLTELGVGNAIIFNLYKPIAQKDEKKICMLMNLYSKVYRIIGIIILAIGICLIPFLDVIIKDDISFFNAPLIFVLYLLQSVSTYMFFAYKRALIVANQKEYKIIVLNYVIIIASNLTEVLILYFTRSFELYVSCLIFFNLLQNIIVGYISNRMYPFAGKKIKEKLPKSEIKEIFKNCYAIFIYKVNSVVINSTDNIVLSIFIGLEIVGFYSNYVLIYTSIRSIIVVFYNAITASLGNLHASGNSEHEYFIFKFINLITAMIFGVASVGFFVVSNKFIILWIGEEFLLETCFAFLMATELFLYGFLKVLATFRTAMGLFQQAKYRPVFGMIINLAVSLILVQYIGIYGIVIGTLASNILTYLWYDPNIIYKYGFKRPSTEYFISLVKYALTIFFAGVVAFLICNIFPLSGWLGIFAHAAICSVVVILFMLLVYVRTQEVKYLIGMIKTYSCKLLKIKQEKMKK